MKKHLFLKTVRYFFACLFFLLFLPQLLVKAEEKDKSKYEIKESELYAQSAVLMDADSGRILFEKNGQEQRPMASTTKIMTLIVTLENANLEDFVSVSEYAASMPDVQLNMRKGERYQLKDLVYSMMLESHNDSAVAIAEYVGGKDGKSAAQRSREESKKAVAEFCVMMNQKARDIGCFQTCFLTPNGLDAEIVGEKEKMKIHSTTAVDLARIMSYCITKSPKKEAFLQITEMPTYTFQNKEEVEENEKKIKSGNRTFQCRNHNAFLTMMQGAMAGKTGFTSKAGYCYVGAVKDSNRTYVVALLACGWPNNKGYKWTDTKKMMTYGKERYEYQVFDEIPIEEKMMEPVIVKNAQTDRIGEMYKVPVLLEKSSQKGIQGILVRDDERLKLIYEKKEIVEAPIKKGEILGKVTYRIGEETWKCIPVIGAEDVNKINYKWCFTKIKELFVL